jgi:glyceraldehyde 3-phosphate dehydrogenase
VATKVGISGFGRVGRQVLKAMMERHGDVLETVAINDITDAETNAHLFKYDSNYGRFPGSVTVSGDTMSIDGHPVKVLCERDPHNLPWGDLGVEIVIESTGIFRDAKDAGVHIARGAKKVIITAPAKNEDVTLAMGVNQEAYDPANHHIVSNASCTTNCLAPMAKVLHTEFGIERGFMTTIHSYTNDQKILDLPHKDLRRARAAALSMIPTTTGAAKAIGLVMPELKGKLHGMAIRVPTPTVSIVDLVVLLKKGATPESINAAMKSAASGDLKGILEYTQEPLVSVDFKGNPASCIFDSLSTLVLDGSFAKVIGWYDNEWGYSCRTSDLAAMMASKGM